jgi:hypothetical protein
MPRSGSKQRFSEEVQESPSATEEGHDEEEFDEGAHTKFGERYSEDAASMAF